MPATATKGPACRICGRALTNPDSVALGIGPVCAMGFKHTAASERNLDMFGAPDYHYELVGEVVVIYDHDTGGMSVTNAAQDVVATIARELGDLEGRTVIYRDSDGVFDGIHHQGGRWAGFYPLRKTDLEAALLAAAYWQMEQKRQH